MGLAAKYKRWRHGRGYGVHSPLAYELITAVLPDTPAYYADATIRAAIPDRRRQRIARIVLRLTARFQPRTVAADALFRPIVTLADSRIKTAAHPDLADMAVNTDGSTVVIRIGKPAGTDTGPIVLDNDRDLRIVVYRAGLSSTIIKTTL